MISQQGLVVGLLVVAFVALAYYSMSKGADATKTSPPDSGGAPTATLKPRARAASNVRGADRAERARLRMDKRDVYGPGVAQMSADVRARAAGSTKTWAGFDSTDPIDTGFLETYGDSGSDYVGEIAGALPSSIKTSHKKYVDELKRAHGGKNPSMGGMLPGQEFTQPRESFTGIWPLLRRSGIVDNGIVTATAFGTESTENESGVLTMARPQ